MHFMLIIFNYNNLNDLEDKNIKIKISHFIILYFF